jgi:hypothetical protein
MVYCICDFLLQAGFGHRTTVAASPDADMQQCAVRVRLVPSLPHKAGAVWYHVPLPVMRGFETQFTFQVCVLSHAVYVCSNKYTDT